MLGACIVGLWLLVVSGLVGGRGKEFVLCLRDLVYIQLFSMLTCIHAADMSHSNLDQHATVY